jgi:hypothetical protein
MRRGTSPNWNRYKMRLYNYTRNQNQNGNQEIAKFGENCLDLAGIVYSGYLPAMDKRVRKSAPSNIPRKITVCPFADLPPPFACRSFLW